MKENEGSCPGQMFDSNLFGLKCWPQIPSVGQKRSGRKFVSIIDQTRVIQEFLGSSTSETQSYIGQVRLGQKGKEVTPGSPLSNVGLKLVWTQMLGSSTQVRTERKGSDCAGRQTARDGSHPYSRLILILMLIHTQVLLIVVMMISHSAELIPQT